MFFYCYVNIYIVYLVAIHWPVKGDEGDMGMRAKLGENDATHFDPNVGQVSNVTELPQL